MKFFKGGYQILNLAGVSESPTTFPGAYKKCLSGKPILVVGIDGIGASFMQCTVPTVAEGAVQLFGAFTAEEAPILSVITVASNDSVSLEVIMLSTSEG